MLFICSSSAYHLFQCNQGRNAVKKREKLHETALQDENLGFTKQIPVPFSIPCCFAFFFRVCFVQVTDIRILWSILVQFPTIFRWLHSSCRPIVKTHYQFSLPGCGTFLRGPGSCRQNTVWLPVMLMLPRTPKNYMLPMKTILI